LALIIRRPSREHVAVLQNRLERRRIPQLQGIGRLHVVMSVDQNCPAPSLMFVARPNNRMPTRWDELRLQADAREFFHQPPCALLQLLLMLVVGRDTRKPQERIILLEIIVAHDGKIKPAFPRTSNTHRTRRNCRAGASPAQQMWQAGALALQQQHLRVQLLRTRDGFSHKIQDRRERQYNSSHEEFANSRMRKNPDDGEDRQSRHNFHSREIEGLTI